MIVSGLTTILVLAIGAIGAQSATPNCDGAEFRSCVEQIVGRAASAEYRGIFIFTLLVFLLFVIVIWFLTGMFTGWLAVRHIRRLEPGITSRQGWGVSAGWGCGAIVAALVTIIMIVLFSSSLRL